MSSRLRLRNCVKGLSAVQLHGSEVVADWARFPRPVLKAMPVEAYADSPWQTARAAILVDAHDPVTVGGTNAEDNLMALCHSCHARITVEMGDRWHDR